MEVLFSWAKDHTIGDQPGLQEPARRGDLPWHFGADPSFV